MHPYEPYTPPAPPRRRRRLPLILAAIAGILGLLAVGWIVGTETATSGRTATTTASPTVDPVVADTAAAKQKCHNAVLKWLKAPATAQFSGDKVVSDPAGGYEVVGNVDSQNGFGAMLRSTYTCHTGLASGTHAFVS